MFCQNCGVKLDKNAKYCCNCGAKLTDFSTNQNERREERNGFSLIQQQYIDKISKEVFFCFCQGMKIDKRNFYENAKLYEMSEEQVDHIIDKLLLRINKVYEYIRIEMIQNGDYMISDDTLSSIERYGKAFDLSESDTLKIVEKYKMENRVDLKQEMYRDLFYNEFSTYIMGKKNDLDQTILCKLSNEEQDEVIQKYNKNLKTITRIIDQEYRKIDEIDLTQQQMMKICKESHKYGFRETEDIYAIITKYQEEHGILEKKKKQEEEQLCKVIDLEYAKEIRLFGISKPVAGRYFFKDILYNKLINHAVVFRKEWEQIDKTKISAISDMAFYMAEYGSNIVNELNNIEEKFPSLQFSEFFLPVQNYIVEMIEDICAASEVCKNIDSETDLQMLYRQVRKEYRSKWMGGGFGLSGAIKGAITAGVLNMGSGAVHATINAIGNENSKYSANSQKRKIVLELHSGTSNKVEKLTKELINDIIEYISSSYPSVFKHNDKTKEKDIYMNFEQGAGKLKKQFAIELLAQNPYESRYYEEILKEYPKEETKEDLLEIGITLGIRNISAVIYKLINTEIDKCFENVKEGSFDNLYKWISIKYSQKNIREKKLKFVKSIEEQIRKINGKGLEKFLDNLSKYEDISLDSELNDELTKILVNFIAQGKEVVNIVNDSNFIEIENEIDDLVILKKIASDQMQVAEIDDIVEQFVYAVIEFTIDQVNIRNVDDICQKQMMIQSLEKKYGKQFSLIFEKHLIEKINLEINQCSTKEGFYELETALSSLELKTNFDLENEKVKVKKLLNLKIKEERTVYDYYLDITGSIPNKKALLLSKQEGILFDTIEEAKQANSKIDKIKREYERCDVSSYNSVNKAVSVIKSINEETGFGNEVLTPLMELLHSLDVQRRTVLGILYETVEEADAEREKVVGNKKYESKEEADRIRERLRHEQEVENQERDMIQHLESKNLSPIVILKELLSNNLKSQFAIHKISDYNNQVLNL